MVEPLEGLVRLLQRLQVVAQAGLRCESQVCVEMRGSLTRQPDEQAADRTKSSCCYSKQGIPPRPGSHSLYAIWS